MPLFVYILRAKEQESEQTIDLFQLNDVKFELLRTSESS